MHPLQRCEFKDVLSHHEELIVSVPQRVELQSEGGRCDDVSREAVRDVIDVYVFADLICENR